MFKFGRQGDGLTIIQEVARAREFVMVAVAVSLPYYTA